MAIKPEQKREFARLLGEGHSIRESATRAGFSERSGRKLVQDLHIDTKALKQQATKALEIPEPLHPWDLDPIARDCLEDFGRFRARFFGRKSSPWQEHAAELCRTKLATPYREYGVVNVAPGSGKALALDTPLPTPTGWTTMAEVQIGDLVLHPSGRPTEVVAKSDVVVGRPCYTVTTDDGHEVVADADHQWLLRRAGLTEECIYTSQFIARRSPKYGIQRPKHLQVGLTAPLDLPEADLSVDPYVMGVWLGDGCWSTSSVSMTPDDATEVRPWIEKAGYITTDRAHPQQFGVLGLKDDLRAAGITKSVKQIPTPYFRGSREQRLNLLQGLMDSDGHVRPDGLCVFSNTRLSLARGVQELVHSLGAKGRLTTTHPKDRRPAHSVFFYLDDAARLTRKADRLRVHPRSTHRGVTAEPTVSVPTQCIQVAAGDGLFLAGRGMVVTHNSTLFTHDIPAWLTCRSRSIRGFIGSSASTLANSYIHRLRNTLESNIPMQAKVEELQLGLATDAVSTIPVDYGRFKPLPRPEHSNPPWTRSQFTVEQLGFTPTDHKEATWTGFGMDALFLGWRVNFVVWDDLVTQQSIHTQESIEKQRKWWLDTAQTRLEPSGLLILQGQRLGGDDLYRFALDLDAPADIFDLGDESSHRDGKKYFHIVYPAHNETVCAAVPDDPDSQVRYHHPHSPPYDPRLPDNDPNQGCLLEPIRLSWRDLLGIQAQPLSNYRVVYQQEDADPNTVLVPRIMIEGGHDPQTGVEYPGCLDHERKVAEIPAGLSGIKLSVVTVDPSPARYWSVQWWLYVETPEQQIDGQHRMGFRYLLDMFRDPMGSEDLLDFNMSARKWTGLLEDWHTRSRTLGHPISHLIVEANAAQRFMLRYDWFRNWLAARSVTLIPHTTTTNKADAEFGVGVLRPHYRFGRIRLPYADAHARAVTQPLIHELTHYPDSLTDDCVMANWFFEYQLPNVHAGEIGMPSTYDDMPSWLSPRAPNPLSALILPAS